MLKGLKRSTREEEIRSVLNDLVDRKQEFIVWSRTPDQEIIFSVKAELIGLDSNGDYLFGLLEKVPDSVDGVIYFAVKDSSIIFKADRVKIKKNIFFVSSPEEAHYKERREFKRERFKLRDHKELELIIPRPCDDPDPEPFVILSKLVDVSEGGVGFIVSKASLDKMGDLEVFEVKSLSDVPFPSTRIKVMSSRKMRGRKLNQEELFVVGACFF